MLSPVTRTMKASFDQLFSKAAKSKDPLCVSLFSLAFGSSKLSPTGIQPSKITINMSSSTTSTSTNTSTSTTSTTLPSRPGNKALLIDQQGVNSCAGENEKYLARETKRRWRPQIAFEWAESEIDALSDACVPPSGAQAKSQEASTPMLDFDRRAIMVYGIPPSDDLAPLPWVEYDISKLRLYFSKVLSEDESVSVCKT